MAIPKRVSERMMSALKRFQPVIQQQSTRDVSEADTVTIVKDLLSDVFGYDKYSELTGELAIRGTYCDLGVKVDEKIVQLIEVKAIGLTLTDRHVKQAVDYAANQGIEWVILTNAVKWQLYHVIFSKPIDKRLILEVDLLQIEPRKEDHLEQLFPLTKEGLQKGAAAAIRDRQDATSRFLIAALLRHNDSVLNAIRRELRRVVDVNVSDEEIGTVLANEVIKRDALEGPPAEEAAVRVKRSARRSLRSEQSKSDSDEAQPADGPADEQTPSPGQGTLQADRP
ncbi:MAG: type I restriction enzyme HsdR N-terminal domain-containing protein [Phycisphaerae bacterium]|nr:type I restriction enzyme HsdR N-terminal domain-containing protein [Phycisphaerae bacterium]